MDILVYSAYYQPEQVGPAIFLGELAADLVAAGHRVRVLTGFPNYPDGVVPGAYRHKVFERERLNGVDVIRTYLYASPVRTMPRRVASFSTFIGSSLVGGALAAPRADVIYVTLPPLPLGVTAWALARLKGARLVVNLQDIHPEIAVAAGVLRGRRTIRFFEAMERWVYRHAERLVVISEGFRENLLAKGVPESRIRVVPNWADPDFVRPDVRDEKLRAEWGRDHFALVYSGGLTYNSHLDPVIEAAAVLRDEPFRFVIIGDGVRKAALEDSARTRRLLNVTFMPFQPLERYPKVLSTADMNLVTLSSAAAIASVPSKIYKTMASGRPVLAIAPTSSEIARLVKAVGCGFVVEPEQVDELVRVLRYAASHPQEIGEMGRRGRQYLEQHLARKVLTGRIAEILSEVVSERRG
ncbi:MAG TPA: glycosyltransferase family 4 protein [Terriglobia bacterium]|nr:glycosyltransferase family 4 protein [Terriglobia bacterium]